MCKGQRIIEPRIHAQDSSAAPGRHALSRCLGPANSPDGPQTGACNTAFQLRFDDPPDRFTHKSFNNVIFHAYEQLGAAGIALPGTAAEQLTVDTLRFVTLRCDDMQAAEPGNSFAQNNIGAPPCHVGGNGYSSPLPGQRNDAGLFFVPDGIQDLELQAGFSE